MPEATEPSLSAAVTAVQADQAPASTTTGANVTPNLRSYIAPSGGQSDAAPATAHTAAPAGPQTSQTASSPQAIAAAAQRSLREQLQGKGFNIPSEIANDDALVDHIASQIDAVNKLRDDPVLSEFRQSQTEFNEWKQSRMSQRAAESAQGNPAAPATAPTKPSGQKGPSPETQRALALGQVLKSGNEWVAASPEFKAAADEMNMRAQRSRTNAEALVALLADGGIEDHIDARVEAAVQARLKELKVDIPDDIKQLQQHMQAEAEAKKAAAVQAWVTSNAERLYADAEKKTLSKFGQLYAEFESDAPESVANDVEKRHEWVLRMLKKTEHLLTPEPAPEPVQKPSLLGQAARRSNGTNRLSSFSGPADAQSPPPSPRGKGGVPSLAGIIRQTITE